jgi:hypothetical protein
MVLFVIGTITDNMPKEKSFSNEITKPNDVVEKAVEFFARIFANAIDEKFLQNDKDEHKKSV